MSNDPSTNPMATGHEEPAHPAITALLRDAYAPPASDLYWKSLERCIVAQVAETRRGESWWSVLAEWRVVGLAAAVLTMLATGTVVAHEQRIAEQARQVAAGAAYHSVFDEPADDLTVSLTVSDGGRVSAMAPDRPFEPLEP